MTHRSSLYVRAKSLAEPPAALLLLAIAAPLLAAVALLVVVRLGRPVLFCQERSGLSGRRFRLVKFRSMSLGRGSDEERLGAFGRWLRATSLDETPALWNVVRGEMSFVGPRPLLPEYDQIYSERQALRLAVRPGITGLAQVSGRNALSWRERLELDAYYAENASAALDLRIIALTVDTVVRRRGVNHPGHVTMPPSRRTQAIHETDLDPGPGEAKPGWGPRTPSHCDSALA